MLGNLDPSSKKATIVGAGISGLIIAYTLKKRGFDVRVLEASSRAGGLVETISTTNGPVEAAAHSLLVTPEIESFFKDLGVDLIPVNKDSGARFIYRNGKMRRMPLRFIELISTLYRVFRKPSFYPDWNKATLAEWGNAYLGAPALRYLLSPFITGVYACSPSELHAKITFPKLIPNRPDLSLFQWLRRGEKKSRPKMMAPKNGMGEVIERLVHLLKENIEYNTPVSSIENISGNLILTVPTAELSKLIVKTDPRSAELLLQVRYAPLVTVTCFYKKADFKRTPKGVGVLIPRSEGLRILGCLFNSSSFENRTAREDVVSLTVMLGGTQDPGAIDLSDDEIASLINQEIRPLLSSTSAPVSLNVHRWKKAIPVYSRELSTAQNSLTTGFCSVKGNIIFTNYSKEVSIRSLINASQQI